MAKTIKFNLVMDGNPVRTIEELQDNFVIEDVLKYYNNGLLLKWLQVRGFTDHYNKVLSVRKEGGDLDVIKSLINIFDIENDESKIETEIYILRYLEQDKAQCEKYVRNKTEKATIIREYHSAYEELKSSMVKYSDDYAMLKSFANNLAVAYFELFRLDYYKLYFQLEKDAPKAVFAILANEKLRDIWIRSQKIMSSFSENLQRNAKEIMGNDLCVAKKQSADEYPDVVEEKDVRVMVLWLEFGAKVQSADKNSEKLGAQNVRENLPILQGLQYFSTVTDYEVWYLEVYR